MSAITQRRIVLVWLATAGLLVSTGMLFGHRVISVPLGAGTAGAIGSASMGLLAAVCAAAAAAAAQGGQRRAWIAVALGLVGWTVGSAAWCYVAVGGAAPISNSSVSELGYVVLPLFAMASAIPMTSRDDSMFGVGLVLDGILVSASLLEGFGSLALNTAAEVTIPRILMAAITTLYLGLVVMGLIITRKAETGRRLSPAFLSAGFAAIGAAGVFQMFENHPGRTPDNAVALGWIVGVYFLAIAALTSRPGFDLDSGLSRPTSRLSMLLPYLPLAFAATVGAVHFWPADAEEAFVYTTGLVVGCAVLVRHLLALDRKRRLLAVVADATLRDTVTGLANRRLLDERLAHAAQLHQRLDLPLSVLSIRVDDFKIVNDTLGHAASDALLRSVGGRIQASVRVDDTVARLGGDEFVVVVEDRPEVATQVADRIAKAFDSALDIADNRVYVHLSIGVATAHADDESGASAVDLLSQAESARARAEQTSATDVQTFTPDKDLHLGRHQSFRAGVQRLQLLWDLRRAIDDRLLTLVYQPQFEMLSGAVCGAEALLRWEHPTLGTLEPSEFLPLVREHGLTDAVTDVVLSRAVADAAGWHAVNGIPVAVNLWARSLDETALPDRIMSVLDLHGVSPSLLTVEITEELMVADFDRGRLVLNRLRDAGIRVSIDDFGSGYSTLTYLRELPIDEVKLDRQLIAPILYDRRAATIARSVIELAEEFGIASVAEGVENDDTARWLQQFGCDVVQGNFYSGPLPAGEIPNVQPIAARRALPSG